MHYGEYDHPTIAGDLSGGTGVSPAGWLRDNIRAWFSGTISALMRGQPAPMGKRDAYPRGRSPVKQPAPFGAAEFRLTRRYDRGAYAYAYRGGALTYDPIGPGVVTTRPLPVEQPAAILLSRAMLANMPDGVKQALGGNAIFWAPQGINYGRQPLPGTPVYTPQQVAALAGDPALAGGLPSVDGTYIAPADGGFGG